MNVANIAVTADSPRSAVFPGVMIGTGLALSVVWGMFLAWLALQSALLLY